MGFSRRKSAIKFLCLKIVSGKVVRHSLAYLTLLHKMIGVGRPFYLKFWAKVTHPLQKRLLQPIFARISSAVTPSEKSSIIANRKSTTGIPRHVTQCADAAADATKQSVLSLDFYNSPKIYSPEKPEKLR